MTPINQPLLLDIDEQTRSGQLDRVDRPAVVDGRELGRTCDGERRGGQELPRVLPVP